MCHSVCSDRKKCGAIPLLKPAPQSRGWSVHSMPAEIGNHGVISNAGGIMILVNQVLRATPQVVHTCKHSLAVHLRPPMWPQPVLIIAVYVQPYQYLDALFAEVLDGLAPLLSRYSGSLIHIAGDFNLKFGSLADGAQQQATRQLMPADYPASARGVILSRWLQSFHETHLALLNGMNPGTPTATYRSGSTLDLAIANLAALKFHWYTTPFNNDIFQHFNSGNGKWSINTDHFPVLSVYIVPMMGPTSTSTPPVPTIGGYNVRKAYGRSQLKMSSCGSNFHYIFPRHHQNCSNTIHQTNV